MGMHSPLRGRLCAALRHPSLLLGALLCLLVVAAAALSLAWTPWPPQAIDIAAKLQPPSAAHWLGTDAFGRDVASLLMAGARATVVVGFATVGLGVTLGTALGLLAAARPGWTDELVMRLSDFTFAFPAILTAVMAAALYGASAANAVAAICIVTIPTFARIARAAGRTVWARDYVLAARASGFGAWRITWDHVLPNIRPVLIVQATIQFAVAVLAEAALAYLGLGTQPPVPSWGRMLGEAQAQLYLAPQLAIFPGLAIAITVLGLNLLGDGLRDVLDPKSARQPP